MARILTRKNLRGGLDPVDAEGEAALRRVKAGEVLTVEFKRPRNPLAHRLCMALLSLTWKNLPEQYDSTWSNFDSFRRAVACEAGYCEELIAPSGEVFKVPGSLSYDAMDQTLFDQVFPRMMTVCCNLLRMSAPELEAEVSRYADENYGQVAA